MDGIEPVSSHEELQPTVQGGTNQSLNASETASATEERSDNPKRKFDGEAQKGGEGNVADAESKETPAGALILLEQLRARRQARDSGTWDVEDADLEHAQMNDVAVHVISCSSDASDDSSSTEIGKICPMRRSPSSIEFENMTSVPYHAQYQRIVEEEEAAEMERLLQQLDEEQQAVQDMAVAQRYQLMQEQIALIQMQLGNENAEVPDLKWLMANDPDNSHELDEVIAAFAARDDDLPQETPEAPDIPLTCKNFFCRCPWRDNMRKDEKIIRWALICCPLGMPLFIGVIMSLCSIKRRQSVVKALAWLSCALFTLIVCSILVGLAVALAIELKAIEENIPDGSDSSGNESGDAVWSNPYNIFTTTTCGQYGISLKIEHSSKTHILNEEVFGTVAFIGLSRANTWDIMGLLDLSYDHDFDAIAISPPGHGNTTQVEEDGGGFWSPANFLKNGLESCLGVSLAKTVVVSHSNFVTRKYFLPLLMSEIALGFVLFDSSVGTEWMDEYDTDVNDHKFYQVRTKHYRYVGKRRLAAAENIIQALEASYRMRDSPSVIDSSPLHADSPALQQQVPRILAATSLKGYCRAEPEGPDDAFPTNSTLGPFDFFPGKYKLPGWDTARRRYRETPLDAPADEGMETRLVNSEYFAPLRTALAEFLEELKSLSLQGKLQAEQPRPLRFNNRQVEYDKSRENTTKVDPMAVYCIQESATEESVARSGPSSEPPIVHLVDPEKYLLQKKAKALRSSSTTTAPTHATRRRPIHSPPMEVGFSIGAIISNWKP